MKKQAAVYLYLSIALLLTGCSINIEETPAATHNAFPPSMPLEEIISPTPISDVTETPIPEQSCATINWTYKIPGDLMGNYMILVTYDDNQNGLENFIHIPILTPQTAIVEGINQNFKAIINNFGNEICDYNSDCISTFAEIDKDGILHIVIIKYQSYGYGSSGQFSSVNYDTINDTVIFPQDVIECYYLSNDDFWDDFYCALENKYAEFTRYNLHDASIVGFYKNTQGDPVIMISATKIVENADDWYSTFIFNISEKSLQEESCYTFSELTEYK